jgi:catechol 2,3-dioxygenase-like lactoylglutathione lyase family enzyme
MNETSSPRLYRVIVPIDDIDQGSQFYAELLRQPGTRISPGRHYFGCGGVILALYNPTADGDAAVARPNLEHLYFATNDLEGIHQRAQRIGGLSTAIGDGNLVMGDIVRRPWGERSFYMRDPFGNPLCFVDEASLFTARLIE